MGKRVAHKEKIQLINYIACTRTLEIENTRARKWQRYRRQTRERSYWCVAKVHSSRMRQSSLIVALFSFLFCVVLLRRRQRDLHSDHNFGISFCPSLMCAGNAVPVDVLSSSNSRQKRRRDLKGFIILGVVSLLFFQKEALSFPKGERTLQLGFVRWRNF